jgi:hypothetical protein
MLLLPLLLLLSCALRVLALLLVRTHDWRRSPGT